MNVRLKVFALTGFAMLGMTGLLHGQQSPAQPNPAQPNQTPADSGLLIQTETKQVLVDAIVTDKKGNYVADLKAKDFHVQEDGKDQPIKSFSFEADPANGGSGRTHYLVLLFDSSSMNTGDQTVARQAAAKFIDTNAGPDRMMEIVNYGGSMKVAQNFTADAERLKSVVSSVQFPAVSTSSSAAGAAAADFAIHAMLQNLRVLGKGLGSVPGRKILVLFTAGFKLSPDHPEIISEATATINECNKSNVAIYPVDVRGLSPGGFGKASLEAPKFLQPSLHQATPEASRHPANQQASRGFVFQTVAFVPAPPFAPQAKGGGPAPTAPLRPRLPADRARPAPPPPLPPPHPPVREAADRRRRPEAALTTTTTTCREQGPARRLPLPPTVPPFRKGRAVCRRLAPAAI